MAITIRDAADIVVALGGDGLMLQTLHQHMRSDKPIYGMHRGTVGFLMNEFSPVDLHARLAAARETVIHPLLMRATDVHGTVHLHHAINEVSLFRQTHQAARLRILIDERERMAELIADGIIGRDTRPAPPPITCRRRDRSCRSMPRCWR